MHFRRLLPLAALALATASVAQQAQRAPAAAPPTPRQQVPNDLSRHWVSVVTEDSVTTIVEDPKYLNQPFIVSTDFKREASATQSHPTPCVTDAPVRDRTPEVNR